MKFEVNVGKKMFFVILGAILLLAGAFVVYAYNPLNNPAANPAVFGHSANEIEGVCRTDGTGCPAGVGGEGLDVVSVDRVEVFKTEFLSGASVPQKNPNTYYTINMPATIPSNAKGVIMTFVTFSQYSPGVSLYFKSAKVSEKIMSKSISHIDGAQENDYNTIIVPYTSSFDIEWVASNAWNSVEKAYAYVDGYIVGGSGGTPHGKQRFTSSGTFNVPAGVTTVWVSMSGGGAGGGVGTLGYGGAGGGGGEAVIADTLTVISGADYVITVGAGGGAGAAGGSSSFGVLRTVAGGASHLGSGCDGTDGGGSIFGFGGVGAAGGGLYGIGGGDGGGFGGGGGGGGGCYNNVPGAGSSGAPGFVLVEW